MVLTGAVALGMAPGSVGVGWAINPTTAPAVAPTTQVSQATGQGSDTVIAESQEANEAPETGGGTRDVQDPSYATSISAPQAEGVSETDEAKALESLAAISPDQARDAAREAVPGTAGKVELDNENGSQGGNETEDIRDD